MKSIKQILLADNYWVLNKTIVMKLGIETAFFLSNLADTENMLSDEEGWFYQTIETVEEKTTLSRRKQDFSIKQLEDLSIIHTKLKGMPKKRYFKLNYENLEKYIFSCTIKSEQNVHNEVSKTYNKECTKRTANKESIYKENSYKESNIIKQIEQLEISQFLKDKFIEWYEYKKQIKDTPKTMQSFNKMLNQIGKDFKDEKHLSDSIDQSIMNGYKGVFAKKETTYKQNNQSTPNEPYFNL